MEFFGRFWRGGGGGGSRWGSLNSRGGVVDGVFRPISGLQNFGGFNPKSLGVRGQSVTVDKCALCYFPTKFWGSNVQFQKVGGSGPPQPVRWLRLWFVMRLSLERLRFSYAGPRDTSDGIQMDICCSSVQVQNHENIILSDNNMWIWQTIMWNLWK